MPRTVHHRVDLLFTIAGIRTVAELAKQYDVHPTQVTAWKNELLQRATEMFDGMAAEGAADPEKVRELHAKIGELTVERDFLAHALGPICARHIPGTATPTASCRPLVFSAPATPPIPR